MGEYVGLEGERKARNYSGEDCSVSRAARAGASGSQTHLQGALFGQQRKAGQQQAN